MSVRTRFAPSPTGYLHIGGARTALFSWLYARQHGGKFILRIEDTDAERSTDESTQAILDGMEWLGLDHDEGPFFQSERGDIYRAEIEKLQNSGHLYRCYCTTEELTARREEARIKGLPPKYDGRCKSRTDTLDMANAPYALRFRVPEGSVIFKDMIKGSIKIQNSEIEDMILLRSDSTPTYNFCVVVDDATMSISHVIRGDDHISNTAKQILLYNALGFELPVFAHLPMILGADKARLSKRHGATSVIAYKAEGFLPHALVNYLARLGWSHGDQEIFSTDELIKLFSFDNVGKAAGVFNPEKLLWLNAHYIKESPNSELTTLLLPFLQELGVDGAEANARLEAIVSTLKERAKDLKEMAESALFYFKESVEYEEKARNKFLKEEKLPIFIYLRDKLGALANFNTTEIEVVFNALMEEMDLKLGKVAQPVRVALTGGTVSPGIFETLEAMGKEMAISRLNAAITYIENPHGRDDMMY